jgi:hypothetical protein
MRTTLATGLTICLAACSANTDPGSTADDRSEALSTTTTRTSLLANNTSASSKFTDRYIPAARFHGPSTPVTNGDAPLEGSSTSASMKEGIVSKIPVRELLYPGATTKIFVETQSWFCTNGSTPLSSALGSDQCGSHIDVGYDDNFATQAHRQVSDMISRGIDGAIMDWSGQGAGLGILNTQTTSTPAINTGTISLFKAEAEASEGKFQIAVIEDEGVKACAAAPDCDVTSQVISDLDYLAANMFSSPAYLREGGRPVVFFFSLEAWVSPYGKSIDWARVRSSAQGNPLFIFENAGAFGHAASDGAYAWLSPANMTSYPGGDPFGLTGFLPYFYQQAANHPTAHTWGSGYKGFDDNLVNGWGGGRRYIGQQCGKTWLDTMASTASHYTASHQLEGMQLITWDDYEEGSELETGIDNHVAISASVAGSTVHWSVDLDSGAPDDCATAVSGGFNLEKTVHHFAIYASAASDGENFTLLADNVPATSRAFDLSGKLPAGSYEIYVYAVGQPMIRNHLSPAVSVGSSGGTDAGAACGVPTILEPTNGEAVGPAIHLRVSAPSCLDAMIAYIDGHQVATAQTNAIDQWVPVTTGPHTLQVNGWAGSATAHASTAVTFFR